MKNLIIFFLLSPIIGCAHPGIGIVIDSRGNIYYSDLHQVWEISTGKRKIKVRNVHTHELYIDKEDNLYGENEMYEGELTNRYYHYLWILRPNGNLDTLIGPKQAYLHHDYSLARDIEGNEYFLKQFIQPADINHIYKRYLNGKEVIFATGSFKGIRWLHPQKDGSVLYVLNNDVYRIDSKGKVNVLAKNIGNKIPSFKFSGNNITVWGAWQDKGNNVYVAIFSDQTVKKILSNGSISNYYRSKR